MYIKFRNEEDYNKIMGVVIDNNMDVFTTNEAIDIIADNMIEYHLNQSDCIWNDEQLEYINKNGNRYDGTIGFALKQIFHPTNKNIKELLVGTVQDIIDDSKL